jgi:hypothetical protein
MLEVILCQNFCECVTNLVCCVDREYLDEPIMHLLLKMTTTNVFMCLVLGRGFGSLANSTAPKLSSNTLQYT